MLYADVLRIAFNEIRANKLRSFFTLLGIIVSVAFLVAVVAVIQGMNSYVTNNLANSLIGTNAFQVRRVPIQLGLFDDEMFRRMSKRPVMNRSDFVAVLAALPDADAVAITSGAPSPLEDIQWGNREIGDVTIRGITAPYQTVQDYRVTAGRPIVDVDEAQRHAVVVLGSEVAEKLFESANPIGQEVRLANERFEVVGVLSSKGKMLGQSFDAVAFIPLSRYEMVYGHRASTSISIKMKSAAEVASGMVRAEEAMRLKRQLRPGQDDNFSIETSAGLVKFWESLTAVLFSVVPAVVAIGVVVGGIVIMNIMLMAVSERTREIGIRKAVGARARDIEHQFLAEAISLAMLGGLLGVLAGWSFAELVAFVSPLPAHITWWSVALAIVLGAGVGVLFGVYPSRRAARLDPIEALRAE